MTQKDLEILCWSSHSEEDFVIRVRRQCGVRIHSLTADIWDWLNAQNFLVLEDPCWEDSWFLFPPEGE